MRHGEPTYKGHLLPQCPVNKEGGHSEAKSEKAVGIGVNHELICECLYMEDIVASKLEHSKVSC
jgi:hypothetical protein